MAGHLVVVAGLLAVAFLFARIARHAGLPPAAATTLVGIAAGGIFGDAAAIALTPATLAIFLPALIFDGAWAIELVVLRRRALTIAVLAVPGTLVTAAIVGATTALSGLPVFAALTLGAMLAATDPVAVLALFRTLPVPEDLRTIVEGESIANDGVAAVLTTTLIALAVAARGAASPNVGYEIASGLYACAAGIAIGGALALLASRVLSEATRPIVAIAVTLAIAYGAYGFATLAHASGIFASATAGIVASGAAFAKAERTRVASAWDGIANVANAVVFLLVGLNLKLERIFHEPWLIVATIGGVVLARLVLAYVLAPLGTRPRLERSWRHTIALAGIRGGLSLALALGLPAAFPQRPAVIDAVFAVVFTTLVLQGWTLEPILRRLAIVPENVVTPGRNARASANV